MSNHHLEALTLARDGHWDEAHKLVQNYSDTLSCLIHGYLHRQEGDLGNARYWYRRAEQEMPDNTLEEELDRLFEVEQSEA